MARIRLYRQKDLPEVCALIRDTFLSCNQKGQPKNGVRKYIHFFTPEKNEEKLRISFGKAPLSYVAVEGECIIGVTRGTKEKLSNLFVAKEYQGKGIGDALMKRFISESKKQRSEKISISSVPEAVEFYKKYGFKKTTGLRLKQQIYVQPMKLLF